MDGPTSTTSRCPIIAGGSFCPRRSTIGASPSGTFSASRSGRRCRESIAISSAVSSSLREIPSRPASSSSGGCATAPHPCTTAGTSFRSTWRKVGTCGRWFISSMRTSAGTAAKRRKHCWSGARETSTNPGSSRPSTSPSRTGCPSTCSPCSPTGTGSTSSWPSPRAASIPSPGRRDSCSPKRPTTCSWATPGSAAW